MLCNEEPNRLERKLDYISWPWLTAAVLNVYHQNRQREGSGGRPANADIWVVSEHLRQEIHDRARDFWCQLSDKDETDWPFNVDAVAKMYLKIRKRSMSDIQAFDEEIKRHCGPRSLCLFEEE